MTIPMNRNLITSLTGEVAKLRGMFFHLNSSKPKGDMVIINRSNAFDWLSKL